jgi:hypothetical protein
MARCCCADICNGVARSQRLDFSGLVARTIRMDFFLVVARYCPVGDWYYMARYDVLDLSRVAARSSSTYAFALNGALVIHGFLSTSGPTRAKQLIYPARYLPLGFSNITTRSEGLGVFSVSARSRNLGFISVLARSKRLVF